MTSERQSGVLMHISSLPSDYSIGSFGEEAKKFIDFLSNAGFKIWQVLPFCKTDEFSSPYKSESAFGGNPYFIDLVALYQKGLITLEELLSARQKTPYLCEFERLSTERHALLYKAAMRVRDRSKIVEFIKSIPQLELSARFFALKEANGGRPFYEWNKTECDIDTLFFYTFIEYEFFTQWQSIKEYANAKGVKIIGDIPMYVAHDSCEVWSNPTQFQLDEGHMPTAFAGVPPDYFSEDGQFWGNPLYNYEKMKEDGFSWWKERLSFSLKLFDGIRIDHFRAFEAFWSIPKGAKSAKEGSWVKGPGKELIDELRKTADGKLIIAEDLGDITDEVRELLKYSDFPGMRVFQFGFLGDSNSLHLPHNYEKKTVAYTGTHDNNTLLGYIWELDDRTRARIFEYVGANGKDWNAACEAIIRTVMASHADTVILPIQDLLIYGADTRMNTPGKCENNWAYRITREALSSLPAEKFKKLNELFSR